MEVHPTIVDKKQARQRYRQPATWTRNRERIQRYSSKTLPKQPDCRHANKSCFMCNTLTMTEIRHFHSAYYNNVEKNKQDSFILKHIKTAPVQRRRSRKPDNQAMKDQATQYFLYSKPKKKMVRVCQKSFLAILGIKRYRVESVAKSYLKNGILPVENRGGDRKSHKYNEKRLATIEFIKKLNVSEPHYCRGHTRRMYLPAELSINKLLKMFNNEAPSNLQIKRSFFRAIFNGKFNLGFGSPQTDVCSLCLQYKEKIKIAASNGDERCKSHLMIEKRVHEMRAKQFFKYLKDDTPTVAIFSFDCQKNLPLPKIPDQSTYYSRQVYLYNFAIVEGCSKNNLNPQNSFSYICTENQFPKNANLIASAVYHRLKNTTFSSQIQTVRLMADGCAGQNKNSILIGMCQKWFTEAPPHIKKIEIIFPVVGHSYLPSDRVFGLLEKEFRKRDHILNPEDYINIIRQHCEVIKLGEECQVNDWKTTVKANIKEVGQWHISISKCKRFMLKRSTQKQDSILLKGEPHYRTDVSVYKNICKKGKVSGDIVPDEVMINQNAIKLLKIQDVNKLLNNHFGNSWKEIESLTFYRNIVSFADQVREVEDNHNEEENDDVICELQVETPTLVI